MSTCNEFTQNAWRKDLCRNCLRPRSEHNHTANGKEKNSTDNLKTVSVTNSRSGKENSANSRNVKTVTKVQDGLDNAKKTRNCDSKKVVDVNRRGSSEAKTTDKKFKTGPNLGVKQSQKVEPKSKTVPKSDVATKQEDIVIKSALKKRDFKKRRTSCVTFYVGVDYVIGEDGGLNGSDSETDTGTGDVGDRDDAYQAPQSKEEKQLAKLTFDNTLFNSEPANLKDTPPPCGNIDKSLIRSKSIGSQEFLAIEDALLWNPKTFSSYVHPVGSSTRDQLSRKSPPPSSNSDTFAVFHDIDFGEHGTDALNVTQVSAVNGQNEKVSFKLRGVQPHMDLSQPYKDNLIGPSKIVLPFPSDLSSVKNDGSSDNDASPAINSTSQLTAKTSGATSSKLLNGSVESSKVNSIDTRSDASSSRVSSAAKKTTSLSAAKGKQTSQNAPSKTANTKTAGAKSVSKSKTDSAPVKNTARNVKDTKAGSKGNDRSRKGSKDCGVSKNALESPVSVSGSSLSASGTNSSNHGGTPHTAGESLQKGAKTDTPSDGGNKSVITSVGNNVSVLGGGKIEKALPSTQDVKEVGAGLIFKDTKNSHGLVLKDTVTKNPHDLKNSCSDERAGENSGLQGDASCEDTRVQVLVTRRQSEPAGGIARDSEVNLNSELESVKSPAYSPKRKSIKRPAPPPPPPPPGGTVDVTGAVTATAHPPVTRSVSVPTPVNEIDQKKLTAMATRTMSVDAGNVTSQTMAASGEVNSRKSSQDAATPKKNKLSSGSFLRKFLKKVPKGKPQGEMETMPDDRSFSPNWDECQDIEFMDDSFSDGSFDDDLVESHESVDLKSANSTKSESSSDWNSIFKNFGKSDAEISRESGDCVENKTEAPIVRFAGKRSSYEEPQPVKLNRHSDSSLDQSPDRNSGGKFSSRRKSSGESGKIESPQKKWDQEKIDTLRKSRDISAPLGIDGKPQTLSQRPVSVAVRQREDTLNESRTEKSPRPRSLEKLPMNDAGRNTVRREQKPIKKPPAPPPPIPTAALQKRAEERVPLETMTLDRKSRGSPRPTSTGDQITRPKPPPPPPPSTLPRSKSSPDKNPLPKRPPPPKFKPQMQDQNPKPDSHVPVYEEYGTRNVRGTKPPAPTARHQYEYIFDKPGKGRSRDNSPAGGIVKHEYGMAYEPFASPEDHEMKPRPQPKPGTKKPTGVNAVPKPKRSHLYEVIHADDREAGSHRAQPQLYNGGRYEAVDEVRGTTRHKHEQGREEEDIYDVVEVPPIPVNPPESPTSPSRYSRSFEDYLVPIRRGSVDAVEGSGTDDEILEEDTLGSLPDLPTADAGNHPDDKKDEGQSVGLLESVLQKLKEPKKLGRKSSTPEVSKSKKLFSSRSLTRRPRSSRHNSLPAGVDIVMIKSQECDSLKSGSGSAGTGSIKSGSTGPGSVQSSGSVEEYVDMSGTTGKEEDPSPSSSGSLGDSGNSPMLPVQSKPQTPSVRGRTCLPPPPTLTRGNLDMGEANVQEMFSNIANMNLQTLNQVLRDLELPKKSKSVATDLVWDNFILESEVPLMRSAALAFYKALLKASMEPLVLMVSFDKVPDELSSKFHCNGLKQRCNFEDDIPCQFHPDSILQQIVGANMGTALTSHCRVTVLEYTNISTLDKYLDTFIDDTDEYFREVCFILVQLLQYCIYLLDCGYEFSDLTAESLLITQSGQSKNHVLLNPGQVHPGNGDKLKMMCQEIVTLILKLHEIDSFEIYDKMSHLPYKKTVMKITQLLSAGQFSNLVQGLDMLGFVLWGPTKELRQIQRSNNIALECQCWLDVECAKMVNSLARGEDRDSIWTYYHVKYLCEMDGRKLATICDTYNLGAR